MIEFSNLKEMPQALNLLQAKVKNPARNKKAYNYFYADMDTVLDCIRPVCNEFGFSVVQMPYNDDGVLGVETLLIHNSGEYIKGRFGSQLIKHDPQTVGSQISYYRRYSLLAIFNLSQEDDDGLAASSKKNTQQSQASTFLASDAQKKMLYSLMGMEEYNKHKIFIEEKMNKTQASEKIKALQGSKK